MSTIRALVLCPSCNEYSIVKGWEKNDAAKLHSERCPKCHNDTHKSLLIQRFAPSYHYRQWLYKVSEITRTIIGEEHHYCENFDFEAAYLQWLSPTQAATKALVELCAE